MVHFSFLNNILLYGYTIFHLSIHRFINIGLFLIFGYCEQCYYEHWCTSFISVNCVLIYIRYIPRSWIDGSYGNSYVLNINFWGTARLFSIVAAPFYNTTSEWAFKFPYILINMLLFILWTIAILVGMNWCVLGVFTYTNLLINDAEHLFLCLLVIDVSSLDKYPFR